MRHPVRELLTDCARVGRVATRDELDGLRLTGLARIAVSRATAKAAQIYVTGDVVGAGLHALEQGLEIVGALPETQRDPYYLVQPEDLDLLASDTKEPSWA